MAIRALFQYSMAGLAPLLPREFSLRITPVGNGKSYEIVAVHVAPAYGIDEVPIIGPDASQNATVLFNDVALLVTKEALPIVPVPIVTGTTARLDVRGSNALTLAVKVGQAPTAAASDCRPASVGGRQTCVVEIPNGDQAATVFLAITGGGDYTLTAAWEDAAYPSVLP